MGIFAGIVTHSVKRWGFETKEVFIDGAIIRGDFHDEDYPDERLRCGCKQKFCNRVALKTSNKFLIFLAKSSEMLWMVGKYVLVGVVIGAIVERYMPSEWIYYFFGRKDPLNVLWITLASVPMFLHQISASSILFHIKSSLSGTLDSGSALAFMIGGPVTAMPTLVMFWTIFRKKVFVLYLTICIVGTLIITYSIQALFFVPGIDTGNAILKGVGKLSGGVSSIIRKQGENVRIVMDPADKPLVATYSNLLGKEGGVIFEAGSSRFVSENLKSADNGRYIANIADWLEQNSNTTAKGSILAYDMSAGKSSLHDNDIFSKSSLGEKSFQFISYKETPHISSQLLEKRSQVWLFFGAGKSLSEPELKSLFKFCDNGGSLLIVSGEESDHDALNRLSSRFGVNFYGKTERGNEIPVAVASPLFYRAAEMIGNLLKLTHKA
jgi:hypothetical protein